MTTVFSHLPRYTIVGAICAAIYNVVMIAGAAPATSTMRSRP